MQDDPPNTTAPTAHAHITPKSRNSSPNLAARNLHIPCPIGILASRKFDGTELAYVTAAIEVAGGLAFVYGRLRLLNRLLGTIAGPSDSERIWTYLEGIPSEERR